MILVLLVLGYVAYTLRPGGIHGDAAYYTPGVTPKREDCVIARMKSFAKIDKMVLQSIAAECELTVQSIEGHETLRKAWEQRQAARDAAPKPEPAAVPDPAPSEGDRLRRVWR